MAEDNVNVVEAVQSGDVEALKRTKKPLDKPEGNNEDRPIHWACNRGQLKVVEYLASRGVPLDTPTKAGTQPVFTAAASDHVDIVKFLTSPDGGKQPLTAKHGKSGQTIGELAKGKSAKKVLAWWESSEVQKRLTDLGVDEVDVAEAAKSGDVEALKRTKFGHDLSAAELESATAILSAGKGRQWARVKAMLNKDEYLDPRLLSHPDENGWTLLHYASRWAKSEIVNDLVDERGVEYGPATNEGDTPLILSAEYGHTGVMEVLLAAGDSANSQSSTTGISPLMQAARFGSVGAVKLLLQKGAKTTLEDKAGKTAAQHAGLGGPAVPAEAADECRTLIEGGGGQPDRVATHGRRAPTTPAPTPPAAPTPTTVAPKKRREMFENEGTPVDSIECPKDRPSVDVKEAVEQVGKALGLWEQWGPKMGEMWGIAEELQQFGPGREAAKVVGDPDMCSAITCYTYELKGVEWQDQIYCRLTSTLRGRKQGAIKVWEPYLFYLLSGMQRMPNHAITLYRGVNRTIKNQQYYDVGSPVTWSTMTSTSKDKKEAKEFLLKGLAAGGSGVLFEIKATASIEISALSKFPEEQEFLMPVNCKFTVTDTSDEEMDLPEGNGRALVTTIQMIQTKSKEVWG